MTATLVLSAAPGTRDISVEGPDGVSNAIPFVIQASRRAGTTEFNVTHLAGGPGGPGYADGIGVLARFNSPTGLWGVNGNLYVGEIGSVKPNNFVPDSPRRVRKVIAATGEVSTVVTLDQCPVSASGTLFTALSLWADATHLYVGDHCLHVIYKIDANTKQVTILALPSHQG